ncbi:MAG: RIP metalloprotease RseP [Rickettsiaceae bacterium]|nr:MAG: RIP metalloprotease RseP [Rickettsiaceae bacterium]
MLSILGFIITTLILVFVHEMGHFLVAKMFSIKIEEFSIGFGEEIYSRTDKSGTKWRLAAIPLGGFVKMYGDPNSNNANHNVQSSESSFQTKPLYVRFLVLFAGPAANYLFAIMILASVYLVYGKMNIPPVIGKIEINSPADKAGLKIGDQIVAINQDQIDEFVDIRKQIMLSNNEPMNFVIKRDEKVAQLIITPISKKLSNKKDEDIPYIGISPVNKISYTKLGLIDSISQGTKEVFGISKMTLQALWQMVIGSRSTDQMHGPLTIAKESGENLASSPLSFILFLAMLSINLGLVNLLPIPLLDGGHLLFMIYEGILRKPINIKMQNILLRVGMIMIVFLIVISVSNDIKSLLF